jgi:inner membrane protein
MDSLTQIVLGAAVGEAVLGKKLGNRAIVWGAIAGTIPDLDVIPGNFMDELSALAFHRGLTHSITFVVLASFLFSWLAKEWYSKGIHDRKWAKVIKTGIVFFSLTGLGGFLLSLQNNAGIIAGSFLIILGIGLGWRMWKKYLPVPQQVEEVSLKRWYLFFFLALLTHTLLDCFTTYGTQLFYPFTDARIAWDSIHVVDPFYTLPFLICLIVAMFYKRSSRRRRNWGYAGIIISSVYLLMTFFNKSQVRRTFEEQLSLEGIEYKRIFTTPTFFNNILWFCVAEIEGGYVHGYISLLDEDGVKIPLIESKGNHELTQEIGDEHLLSTLRWFSNDYFLLEKSEADQWNWKDLRFGDNDFAGEGKGYFFFHFIIEQKSDEFSMRQNRDVDQPMGPVFKAFWVRLQGLKE